MRTAIFVGLLLATGAACAENCTIDLAADDQMKFDKSSITVSASCKTITINLAHTGTLPIASMGHNVVIAATSDVQAIGTAGMSAGVEAAYLPPGDARVLAHTSVVGGGDHTTATFPGSVLKAGGDYAFFCSFPGHWAIMKGKLVVE